MAWSVNDPLWIELHSLAVKYAAGTLDTAGEERLFGVLADTVRTMLVVNWGGRVRACDLEEIGAEMWPAILRAMRKFDETRSHFASFFYRWFRAIQITAMKRVFLEQRKAGRVGAGFFSLTASEDARAFYEATIAERLPDENVELRPFADMIAPLDDRLQGIFTKYYVDDLTFREVGDTLGVTKQRAQQLLDRGHGLLRLHWGSARAMALV